MSFWNLPTVLGVAGISVFILVLIGVFKVGKKNMKAVMGVSAIAGIVLLMVGMSASGTFRIQDVFQASTEGTIDAGGNQVTTDGNALPIKTLKVFAKEKYSNSYTSVGGTLYFYPEGTDISKPNAKSITSATVTSGQANLTDTVLMTNTPYEIAFDGGTSHYDYSFGNQVLGGVNYDQYQGLLTMNLGEIASNGSIADPLTETTISGDINGVTALTTLNNTGSEIYVGVAGTCANSGAAIANDETICYNETTGDNSFYVYFTAECVGGNKECQEPVMCFEWASSNPVEGNEFSSITVQRDSGTDLGIPSNVVDWFAEESCLSLGDVLVGGTSGKYKITFTVDESNTDASDYFNIVFDDLGDINGKTDLRNTKIGKTDINFGFIV